MVKLNELDKQEKEVPDAQLVFETTSMSPSLGCSGMVFFMHLLVAFVLKVRRQAAGRCHKIRGRLGFRKEEQNSRDSERRPKAQLLQEGK